MNLLLDIGFHTWAINIICNKQYIYIYSINMENIWTRTIPSSEKHSDARSVGFTHCFLWDHMEAVELLCKYGDWTYISSLYITHSQKHALETYTVQQNLYCCDLAYWIYCYNLLRLSVVTNLPVKSKPVTRDESAALWEFTALLAGATLRFNVLYFFNAPLVQWNPFLNWTLPQRKDRQTST